MAAEHVIVSIKDDKERVRTRPTIYIPSTGSEGAIHIIYEIIDNSIDELISKDSKGDTVSITFNTKTKVCKVVDDGGGIPHKGMLDALTVINSSGKFENDEESHFNFSGGVNGVGLKLSVFLSEWCTATSNFKGKSLTYKFIDGELNDTIEEKATQKGTSVEFKLDQRYVDINGVDIDTIIQRLEEKAYLFPMLHLNLTITDGKKIKTYKYHGKTIEDKVKSWKPDTSVYLLHDVRTQKVLADITDDELTEKKITIDVAFAFKEDALDTNDPMKYTIAYGNIIKNYMGGAHVEGLRQGLQKYIKTDVIPKFKGKDKEINILPSDVSAGLVCFIVVQLNDPEFRGQYKDQLSNPEVRYAVRDAVYDYLCNMKSTTAIVDFVKRVAKGRMASKKTRKKDVSNAFSKDRLEKFKDIIQNLKTEDTELLLVEGQV